jgi:DNA-binding beta-propeller fold protein YncE
LRKLERRFSRELVVIGVHSPKFPREQDTEAVRQAVLRHAVGHPVVNDRDFRVFQAYAARAWPTLVLIDPVGTVIGRHAGEFPLEPFDRLIAELSARFDAAGLLDPRPLDLTAEPPRHGSPLRFPGKVLVDRARGRLFVADTGHHRIVIADLDGRVARVVGRGARGFDEGLAAEATFAEPQGLAVQGDRLWVADSENHAVRLVDLAEGVVRTLAGTGEQLLGERVGGAGRSTKLSSPWDLAILDDRIYVAMAGTHQIWLLDPAAEPIAPDAGTGAEALVDGPRAAAALNQPSGLTHDGRLLYVADSEASAIRVIDPAPAGEVRTVVGEGLFEFGDRDGIGPAGVRLQHPLGIAWHDGLLYVADTYNHKIKRLDPRTGECRTWLGDGQPGLRDGSGPAARFSEPSGVAVAEGQLFIADTNNHGIRVADLASGTVRTLELGGLGPPPRESGEAPAPER